MTMHTNNSLSARVFGNMWLQYASAVAAAFVILLACHASNLFLNSPVPYILLLLVIACAAWYCGLGPAIVAVALTLTGTRYWFLSPTHSLRVPDTTQSVSLLAFLVASGAIIAM